MRDRRACVRGGFVDSLLTTEVGVTAVVGCIAMVTGVVGVVPPPAGGVGRSCCWGRNAQGQYNVGG